MKAGGRHRDFFCCVGRMDGAFFDVVIKDHKVDDECVKGVIATAADRNAGDEDDVHGA